MTQDKFAQALSPSIGRPDVLKIRASAKNRKNRKHRKDNGKKTTKADGTLGNLLKKTPVTMHVVGVDTSVGDWGNQDKETGEHKKDCFRI